MFFFIDHAVVSNNLSRSALSISTLDSGSNLSDHLPRVFQVPILPSITCKPQCRSRCNEALRMRWDKANLPAYYNITYNNLHVVADMDCLDNCYTHCDCGRVDIIDKYYMCVVYALQNAAAYYVPRKKASFYKFWWDVEASELKYKSIDAHRLWVAAGRPRIGDCFTTPCLKKTKQICFCQNCVKFPPILIILGRRMANNPNICEVHSFSISPNLRHHLTVLNVNVPNCYITPKVVICNKLLKA